MWHATSAVLACGHEHHANKKKPKTDTPTLSCHVELGTLTIIMCPFYIF